MKNILNKRKSAGFTLLELVVVVAVMGLISTMAMDVYTDNSNQKRFEATKQRLAEIKFAIIGDPMMRVGSQAITKGSFFKDMDRPPANINELINYPLDAMHCVDSVETEVPSLITQLTCEAVPGNKWVSKWNGPYLHNIQSTGGNLVFTDAWGNNDGSNDFGWEFDTTTIVGSLIIKSKGLNRKLDTGDDKDYEKDVSITIYETELDNITALKGLSAGYCIDITDTSNYQIDREKDESECTAAPTTHKWANFK